MTTYQTPRTDLEELAFGFLDALYSKTIQNKPNSSRIEFIGMAFAVLTNALEIYTQDGTNKISSTAASKIGTPIRPRQVQKAGSVGGSKTSTQRIRQANTPTTTRNSKKKRRSKKA